ncbi:exodeoxyribonuclease V subunit alpha [Paraglaciecola arctica]|uniref:RecBCD enzyme subunit RecD n=1 Tax=Paraglaciecola arctica BSs20135 TaxID=493475 RepID=K6YP69_9ALTE|nr:exodeoxyribonuclease V subunit alpha [Paraglaciecola arctica]GAC19967.1 exodeoxyribonuclease V alpha subunit [Paraglaciecola arctica BSs20135]
MLMQVQNNPALKDALEQLLKMSKIRAIDMAFADFVYSEESALDNSDRECLTMLAAYVSAQTGEQHSCINVESLGQPFSGVYHFPEAKILQSYIEKALTFANVAATVSNLDENTAKPLVLQNGKLYLQRYWQYESQLAAIIREKAAKILDLDLASAQILLSDLFEEQQSSLDWQKIAVCIAASQTLSFITGGPGTGKTTTVTKLLALLQGLAAKKGKVLNIQLVAPTGKAAARLTESISAAKQKLPTDLQTNLPEQCQTIHRLLGAKPQSPYFKANASHPLHLDVLVLDEASMVDLPLMAKLFAALPKDAQIILLGDQDQLASVETGSVLSDICAASHFQDKHLQNEHSNGESLDSTLMAYSETMQQHLAKLLCVPNLEVVTTATTDQSVIQDNVVRLIKSHRFGENSGIGQLAKQVKAGQVARCLSLLNNDQFSDINWYQPTQTSPQTVASEILKTLITQLLPIYKQYTQAIQQGDLRQAFQYLHQQQVLCAQKSGYWGVTQLNVLIESELHKQGLIDNSKDFYVGRPVMLSKNDHQLKLFNGDVGIVMPDPNNVALTKVWFVTPEGELRGLLPSRLPSLETLYAMTIHKSQGSEFESVYLCLPPITANNQGRGLNRELIYTGLTRAKKKFGLFGESKALSLSLGQQCVRGSGLSERLLR